MAENQVMILLNEEDLQWVGKIIKQEITVLTPQDAVKWALKHCSATSGEVGVFKVDWDEIPTIPIREPEVPPIPWKPIEPGSHHTAVYRVKDLIKFGANVAVGPDTLASLVPDKATLSTLLDEAEIGIIK